jgi:hypothetical protein
MPAIFAMAYDSLVGSSAPVSSSDSAIGWAESARIDAGASQVEQLLRAVEMRRVDHGRVNQHVVVDELGGARGVGEDAADGAGAR